MRAGTKCENSDTIEIEVKCVGTSKTILNQAIAFALIRAKMRCEDGFMRDLQDWAAFLKGKQSDDAAPIILRLGIKDGTAVKIVDGIVYERWQKQRQATKVAVMKANLANGSKSGGIRTRSNTKVAVGL